jgi:general secretion pathway protein G
MFLKVVAQTKAGDGGRAAGAQGRGDFANVQTPRKKPTSASPPSAPNPRRSRGFTLLEMLAVIVLLGIVGVIVARSVAGRVDTGKWDAGKIGVTKLDQDVQAYALDNGSPPKSLQDLLVKPSDAPSWNGPYAKPADLDDPFGHPYDYVYPGQHGQYDIIFLGRDGKPGGTGMDRDYGNWQ